MSRKLKKLDELISQHYDQFDTNATAALDDTAKQRTKTCNWMYEKIKIYKTEFEKDVTNTTELAISSVNTVANQRNTEITSKLNEVHNLIEQLENIKSVLGGYLDRS